MFITKKHIPRRTFLYGTGVTLALPWLEAMLPAQTPLRAQTPPARFTAIFIPHGVAVGRDRAGAPWWVPDAVGAGSKRIEWGAVVSVRIFCHRVSRR